MAIECEIKNNEPKVMYVPCECADWVEGNAQLDSFTVLAFTHGMHYTGKQFRYCPWCGKKLEANNG